MQTVLTGAGITATVLLGAWAIILTIRYGRTVQITYAHALTLALTNDITQNFPNLQVLFHNQPVSDNLVLLKGYFVNTGKRDISPDMVEKQVTMVLPPGFEWVECKIAESSPDLTASANISSKTEIAIHTGLWKTREYLKLEALAKVPVVEADVEDLPKDYPTHRLETALSCSHRIADSNQIVETRVPRPSGPSRRLRLFGLALPLPTPRLANLWVGFTCVLLGGVILVASYFIPPRSVGYRLLVDGQERVVTLSPGKKGNVVMKDADGFKKECTFSEFDSLPDKHPTVVDRRGQMAIAAYSYGGLGILSVLLFGPRAVRDRRLLAIIADKEEP